MAKIKDESNARDDADLPKRQRGDQPGGFGDKEIGSGQPRTRADGVRMGPGHPDGWQTGGRDENG